MTRQAYDWTFTTRYKGTLNRPDLVQVTEEEIPVSLLMQPDPILFYDDVVLFEDELADNGSAIVTVKLRVMPACFFCLQRFFLRVDDLLFTVIDVRFFHQFGKPFALREYQERSASFEDLTTANPQLLSDKSQLSDMQLIASLLPLVKKYSERIGVPS